MSIELSSFPTASHAVYKCPHFQTMPYQKFPKISSLPKKFTLISTNVFCLFLNVVTVLSVRHDSKMSTTTSFSKHVVTHLSRNISIFQKLSNSLKPYLVHKKTRQKYMYKYAMTSAVYIKVDLPHNKLGAHVTRISTHTLIQLSAFQGICITHRHMYDTHSLVQQMYSSSQGLWSNGRH